MERCRGQAAMVHADHVNSWWGVELLIPLLKHTKYYYFCVKSMCRPMPTRGKYQVEYCREQQIGLETASDCLNLGMKKSSIGSKQYLDYL